MEGPDPTAKIRFSVARDVGGVELVRAAFHRRGVPPHIHDEYSLSVPLRGGLAFDYRGSKHSAPCGVISCIPPGEVHNGYAARGDCWEFLSLLVPGPLVTEVLENAGCAGPLPDLPQRVICDPGLARRLTVLHRLLESARDLLERQSACALVFADFFRSYSTARKDRTKSKQNGSGLLERARELLHDGHAGPIPLARLASYAGLSRYHFLRRFRAVAGLTPHAYLNQIRVMNAKRRLAEGMPAAEAALTCGFCDQSHMARQFKRAALVTPGEYRRAFHTRR